MESVLHVTGEVSIVADGELISLTRNTVTTAGADIIASSFLNIKSPEFRLLLLYSDNNGIFTSAYNTANRSAFLTSFWEDAENFDGSDLVLCDTEIKTLNSSNASRYRNNVVSFFSRMGEISGGVYGGIPFTAGVFLGLAALAVKSELYPTQIHYDKILAVSNLVSPSTGGVEVPDYSGTIAYPGLVWNLTFN